MKNKSLTFVLLFLIANPIVSCSLRNKKSISIPNPPSVIIDSNITNFDKDWTYFSSRTEVDVDLENGKQSISGNLSFRMKKDSIIWFTFNVALGFQVAKGIIKKDSLYVLDNFHKDVIVKSIQDLRMFIGADLTLAQLQNAIIGASLYPKPANYEFQNDKYIYKAENAINTLTVNLATIISSSLETKNSSVNFNYTGQMQLNTMQVPQNIDILATSDQNKIQIKLSHKTVQDNVIPSFPFVIPDGYSRK